MISRLFNKIFGGETEYSKRWMARVTVAVLTVFLFVIPFVLLLLVLHLHNGLSYRMCKAMITAYIALLKVTVSGYFVTFIGYMGKAFLAKKEEENNKLKKKKENDQ